MGSLLIDRWGECACTFNLSFVLLTQETDDNETETVKVSPPPKDTTPPKKSNFPNPHLVLTIISLVLCTSILNFFSYICLIPALISSRKVRGNSMHAVLFTLGCSCPVDWI